MRYVILPLILLLLCSCSVNNNFGVKLENDILAKTDENYTHGTILNRSVSIEEASEVTKRVISYIPDFNLLDTDPTETNRVNFQVGQEIHTPNDLSEEELIVDDNPYAGYLYGKITKISQNENIRLETEVEVGLIGPWSGAEVVQKFVHINLGMGTPPEGWDNQLKNEPQINLNTSRLWKTDINKYIDHPNELTLRVGTVHTDLSFMTGLRYGYNLPDYDLTNEEPFSLFGFTNAGISLVGRNVFYDGNLFRDSHSVTTVPIVGLLNTGVAMIYSGYSVTFVTNFSSKQFKEEKDLIGIFGGLIFGLDW